MCEGVRDELVVGFNEIHFLRLWFNNALQLFQADALEITLRSVLAHLIRPQIQRRSLWLENRRSLWQSCGKQKKLQKFL